ncbi:MAG: hypothetical protein FWD13_08210 [Treponema sp.]|nr:hypothetical protein [Treponema sp.]
MIGFLLKKTLYDLWDNMFRIVVLNLGFLFCIAIPIFLPILIGRFTDSLVLEIVSTVLGIFICSIYLATASFTIKSISDYGTFTLRDFFRNINLAWPAGLAMGLFIFLLIYVVTVVLRFYFEMGPVLGWVLSGIIFWVIVYSVISFQFYFPVYVRLGSKVRKSFKKCLLVSLDNTGLAFFMIIHNIIAFLLSAVFAFMFPGPVGILLYLDEALRLRLLKYDWLEANPGANRRKIPWDELLIEEREKTGSRSIKNFIFPWKD